MLANVFPSPYVDIIKHCCKSGASLAAKHGDVQQHIDKAIGKKAFVLRGSSAASTFLALPKPGPAGLGLRGRFLYLQIRLEPGEPFTIHFDLMTDAKFVVRASLSNRFTAIKQVGTVVQLPCSQGLLTAAGCWTILALDLPALTASIVDNKGAFASLKGVIACCNMSLRAAFTSDVVFTPETLPRDFTLPLPLGGTFAASYQWLWLPGSPAVTAAVAASAAAAVKSVRPSTAPSRSPTTDPGPKGPESARQRRLRSGAAPRALFPPPPQPTEPAEETMLELSRVLGFSGDRLGLLVWLKDGRRVLYAAASLLVLQDIDTGSQQFLIGHTADVCSLSAAETTPLVASAQEGALPIIRLWDRDKCVPLAILQQHASDMHTLSLTADGSLLAAVGKDRRGRQMLAVWDVTQADAPIPSCPLLDAKVSQRHIKAIAWVPPEPMDVATKEVGGESTSEAMQLVSCGYENVRFWRLRRGKLHACGMELQHEQETLFLSIAIDTPTHAGGGAERTFQRRMLIGGSNGRLFVIDPSTRVLEYVHALHEESINAVHLSAGFAVTGGADRKLRVWPLDFSAHFLEAEHEGAVTAIHASPDGLKLLIGTASGTIGMLDVPTVKHATVVRSHTDIIYGLAIDPHNREFVTASCDGTIRVWELDNNQAQLVEFELPSGCARAVAYHPTEYAIACGFDDGSMRVFDIASTSLLEEYTQHHGKVVDLVYTHGGERLFSAGTDCAITAYDAVHAYQPSRSYSATVFPNASPCLAVASDDSLLVAGCLQQHAVLLFDTSTLSVLRFLTTTADISAVAFGPSRTILMTTTEGSLICLPLSGGASSITVSKAALPHLHCPASRIEPAARRTHARNHAAATRASPLLPTANSCGSTLECLQEPAAVTAGAHRAAADALTLTRNGGHVVTGGQDRLIRMWPMETVRVGGQARMGTGPGTCQPYVGHSDHITRLAFSADGQMLVSVGGGDTIFLWEFKGPAGVDPAEVVDESVRQAEADVAGRLAERSMYAARAKDVLPTPAQVLKQTDDGDDDDEEEAIAARPPLSTEPAVASSSTVDEADLNDFEELRQRLRRLDTAEAGYMMAGAEAAMRAAGQGGASVAAEYAARHEAQAHGDGEEEEEDDDDDEGEEDDDDDEAVAQSPEAVEGPRKRYVARVVYGDDQDEEDEDEDGTEVFADGAGGHLAPSCTEGLTLRRIIGFSTHAHDHVIWQPSTATLIYATGDTLVVDGVSPGTPPTYLTGGSGEIATLALSPDGRFAAVGSGGDSPTCIYDLAPATQTMQDATSSDAVERASACAVLRVRLPGHAGGVQSLAFFGSGALASLGVNDCTLKVHSILSGALLLSTTTTPSLHALSVSTDGMEISAAGKGGIFSWRVSMQPEESVTRAALLPLPTRLHPSPAAQADPATDGDSVQLTALVPLSPNLSLAGDTDGGLTLWEAPGKAAVPIAAFDLSSIFSEVDLLHVMWAGEERADLLSWNVVVAGVGPTHVICRFRLTLPSFVAEGAAADIVLTPCGEMSLDGDAIAMSWDAAGEQGVVGTDAGSLWHVQWALGSATFLSGSMPPPLAALAVSPSASQRVVASLSHGAVQGEECGVLLWDIPSAEDSSNPREAACAAPLARIYQPNEAASCIALSAPTAEHSAYGDEDGADGLCAVGYSSGRVQLVSVSSLKLLRERRVHVSPIFCARFGPTRTLLTAAADGEVRLSSSAMGELLTPLATLRAPNQVPITCIDLLFGPDVIAEGEEDLPRWAVASEHQQVEVWPLLARTDPSVPPLASFSLETTPLLTVPPKLQPLGWKCLVAFCPFRPSVVACSGLTRQRKLVLYDYVQHAPLAYLSLSEWPTALAVCPHVPLIAVGGASGKAKMIEYRPQPETESERLAEEAAVARAVAAAMVSGGEGPEAGGGLICSAATAELHCHNVRSLHFAGSSLISAGDDEVAQWEMPF